MNDHEYEIIYGAWDENYTGGIRTDMTGTYSSLDEAEAAYDEMYDDGSIMWLELVEVLRADNAERD